MPEINRGEITIKSGVHEHQVPAGQTVAQYRVEYGPMFRIPPDAKGYTGTTELADNREMKAGEVLEFVKKSGEKGMIAKIKSWLRMS